jgi:hypothetical protein
MAKISKIKLPDNTAYDINAATVNNHTVEADVPADAIFHYAVTNVTVGSASKGADIAVDDITAWSAGSATSTDVTGSTLTITDGTAPSLSYTAKAVPNISTKKMQVVGSVNVPDPYDYYGMIIHQAVSNPSARVEYIGKNAQYTAMSVNFNNGEVNYGGWSTMPTLADNKPAMIQRDGTFDYWLDEDDYSKKEDGTASDVGNINYVGNAFAWFPSIWMKIIESGTDLEVRFAYEQLESDYYEVCPEGSEGVWLPMFYGSPDSSGYMRSIANTSVLGGVTNNSTTDVQNTAIKKNGSDYYFLGGKLLDCITLLEMMWFKSTNSDDWGRGNQDGYNASAFDGRYGTKSNPVVGGGQFYLTSNGTSANKILHSIPLATYDVWLRNPYWVVDKGTIKVSKNYTYDTTGSSYTNTSLTIPDAGYQKELTYVSGYGLVPKTVGASTSSYYCDYLWVDKSIVSVPLSLGYCSSGRYAGSRASSCYNAAGYSYWHLGCALFLKQSR